MIKHQVVLLQYVNQLFMAVMFDRECLIERRMRQCREERKNLLSQEFFVVVVDIITMSRAHRNGMQHYPFLSSFITTVICSSIQILSNARTVTRSIPVILRVYTP